MTTVAVILGHVDAVRLLFDQMVNKNDLETRALKWSAFYGHVEVVRFLLDRGTDIHFEHDYSLRWSAKKWQIGNS